ncbi:MAG: hypothetical protein A3J24_03245 [Deltaproteobacteria bacterium RIFCSPLOWO2_02_FULL_53_8]|nr:MAG: hypothetical protein A3J24_03245 [Deltaproteobacteria bacterium RIFCSPLOWO2_02_FULL_53_8]
MTSYSLFELIKQGGVTVIILMLLSVVSVAFMIERAWAHYKFRKGMRLFSDTLKASVADSGIDTAAVVCSASPSPLAVVFMAGYARAGRGRSDVMAAMELAGRAELSRLDSYVGFLGTIGSTAPFIGLFGTVLGIIRAFSGLAAGQGASPAAVADGIAEALVATAAGLFVAVPAVIAYNYFVRSASRTALHLERMSMEFVDALSVEAKDKDNSGSGL